MRRLIVIAFLIGTATLADTSAWSAVVQVSGRLVARTLAVLPFGPRLGFGGGGGQATPTVTPSMTAQVVNDADSDGKADPGDTIRYTTTIAVSGATATGVHFSDTPDSHTTFVNGSLHASPIANDDTYNWVGNTQLDTSARGLASLTANDTALTDAIAVNTTPVSGPSHGTVTLSSDGHFVYTPALGFTGTDTFTYGIANSQNSALTSTATATINVTSLVWYLQGGASGDGRSNTPSGDPSAISTSAGASDRIYVFSSGAALNGAFTLKNNQQLLGQGVALTVNSINLFSAGAAPAIGNGAGNAVTLASANTLQGFSIQATNGKAIVGASVGTLSVSSVSINNTSGAALDLTGTTPSPPSVNVTLTSTVASGGTNNVKLNGLAGTVNLGSGALSGSTGPAFLVGDGAGTANTGGTAAITYNGTITTTGTARAIDIQDRASGAGNITLSGAITHASGNANVVFLDQNAAGTITFSGAGSLLNGGTSAAVSLTSNTGATINFTGGGLAISSTTGSGFVATGGGTVSVQGSGNTVNASSGTGVDIENMTIGASGVTFGSTASGGGTNNVKLASLSGGAVSLGTGTLSGATGNAFDVNSGAGNISYSGTITNSTALAVSVANKSGGTVAFSGGIPVANASSTSSRGISLTSNTGATINFTGGVALSTGTSTAFTATGGGTVNVTQNNSSIINTLATTSGTALNVANTTIGGSGMTFRSISSNGGSSNGIIVNATGASGGLTVAGNGVSGTGGTIANKTGADGSTAQGTGIYLNSTANVSLSFMQLNDFQNYAIEGVGVAGFTLNNTVVNGTNGTLQGGIGEGDVYFTGLSGAATVSNSTFSGAAYDTFHVFNDTSQTLNRITITNCSFAMTNTSGNDALAFEATGGTFNATVQGSTITSARGDLFQLNLLGAVTSDLVFGGATAALGNTLTNNNTNIVSGGGGVTIGGGGPSNNVTFNYNIAHNSIMGSHGAVLAISKGTGINASFTGTIDSNVIGTAGVTGSGSTQGEGIAVFQDGAGSSSTIITNNQVYGVVAGRGAIDVFVHNGASGQATAVIQSNTIGTLDQANSFSGIYLQTGSNTGGAGDNNKSCLTIGGAGAFKNSIDLGANTAFALVAGITIEQEGVSRVGLLGSPNYSGSAFDSTAVQNYVSSNNTVTGSNAQAVFAFHDSASPAGGGFFGTCPPLMLAEGGVGRDASAPDLLALAGSTDLGRGGASASFDLTAPACSAASAPMSEAATAVAATATSESVTQSQLDAIAAAAIQRWSKAGLRGDEMAVLRKIELERVDLAGSDLGTASGNRILVDRNAQGKGWFVDPEPLLDASFPHVASTTRRYTEAWMAPAGRVDLLTAVGHEMGHRLGYGDSYSPNDVDSLMYGYLTVGERRLPGPVSPATVTASRTLPFVTLPRLARVHRVLGLEPCQRGAAALFVRQKSLRDRTEILFSSVGRVDRAIWSSLPRPAQMVTALARLAHQLWTFAASVSTVFTPRLQASGPAVDVDLGSIAAGKTVTVVFDVTVDSPPVAQYSNHGTASGSNFTAVDTNSVTTTGDLYNTTTALISSLNPSFQGDAITFTATVTRIEGALTPTGTVQFKDNGSNLGSAVACTAAGADTCTAATLTTAVGTGTRSITAVYSGDVNHDTSTSSAVSQVNNACTAAPIVTTTADSLAGSLRDAIANACPGATISFGSVTGTIGLTSGELPLTRDVTISGPGANVLTVQRASGAFRIFHVSSGKTVTISGLTIANGSASGASPADQGGGVLNDHGTLTIAGSTISGNAAGVGGGVYNNGDTTSGSLTIINSTVSGNTSTGDGGGVYNTGIAGGTATLAVTNSTISGNTANGNGGGVYNEGDTSTSAPLTITSATITNNRADNDTNASGTGGGLTNVVATATLRNTIVAGNFVGASPSIAADDIVGTLDIVGSSNNLIGDGTNMTGVVDGSNGNLVGTPGSPVDPKLGPLAANGGPTQTHALLAGSPAIEAGSNTFVAAPPFLTASPITDQRGTGFSRVLDSADADTVQTVDIGAFETHPTIEDITDKSTNEDTLLSFSFNVGDGTAGFDSITAISSNTALVPNVAANINVTGSGATRTLNITPALDQNSAIAGTSTITVTLSKTIGGVLFTAADTFVLTVNAVNDAPTLALITDPAPIAEDSGLQTVNLSGISAGGGESQALVVTATSNNTALIPNPTVNYTSPNPGGSLTYTPAANANGSAVITVTVNDNGGGTETFSRTFTVAVNGVADTPSVTNATTNEDTQTASGLVISRNVADGAEVTHFKITGITNGTLFQSNGTTPITSGTFITFAQANAGLRFTPAANFFGLGSFTAQASVSALDAGLGGGTATATITVNPVADTPSVTNAATLANQQTSSGLVISRNAADGAEVTHLKITNISNGALFQHDGTTPISNGAFITFAEGNAGLAFTPTTGQSAAGSFDVQGALDNAGAGLSSAATATITVNKRPTTTTITSDVPDPSDRLVLVPVTYTVVDNNGGPAPTGNVVVTVSGGSETCTGTVASGQCSVAFTVSGGRTITATYAGDGASLTSFGTTAHSVNTCPATPDVSTTNDSGAGSLRQAIADACATDFITFNGLGVGAFAIHLASGELAINKNLTITGPGASLLTVSGDNLSRVFHILQGHTVSISDLTIANGVSQGSGLGKLGAGIFNEDSALTIARSTIRDSSAPDPSQGAGGAIYNRAANANASLTITASTLSNNTAGISGGAIESGAIGGRTATLTISDSTISGNSAGDTGAVNVDQGGGVATATIVNTTITGNHATFLGLRTGGLRIGTGPIVAVRNSIIAGNVVDTTPSPTASDVTGALDPSSASNLIGVDSGMTGVTNGANGNQVGSAGSPINPRLGLLADNGGPTFTHALLAGSPALDAGDNALVVGTTDQRGIGFARTLDGPDADATQTVDIGAFEADPSVEDITDKTTPEDTPLSFTFAVGDPATPFTSISATSDNQTLVPDANITVTFVSPATRFITITPAADQNSPTVGTATITVTATKVVGGTVVSMSDTFVLTVTPVDDVPTLDAIGDVAIPEDAGPQFVPLSGITAGGGESQPLTVIATSSNPSLIPTPGVIYTSPSAFGTLIYASAADASGSAIITVTVNDGTSTFVRTFTVIATAVNDPPTLDPIANPADILEDAGAQTVNLSGISAGGGETQALTVTATSNNTSLIPNPTVTYSSPNAIGSLSYTPVADANGSAVITVTVTDNGGGTNTFSRTFTVNVTAVDDTPTLTAIPDPAAILEDAGLQTVNLAGISAGGGESQSLSVTATSNNPALIPNPAVNYTSPNATGSLTYTPAADASGSAVITVTVTETSGGSLSVTRTFTVNVTAVNDPPTLDAIADPAAVLEDAGLQTVTLTGITAGGGEVQTLVVTATSNTPALIPNPTVTYTSPSAAGSLSYTPVADANGVAVITVTVDDGGTGTHTFVRTFTVNVTSVNDAPTLDAIADPAFVFEDAGVQTVALTGITAGGGESQTLVVTATSNNTAVIPNPTVSYTSPSATGLLSYTPVADASGLAVITVTVDDGSSGMHTIVRTFTVNVVSVNDPPTLDAIPNPAAVLANAGPQTVNLSGITAGGGETQTLTVTATSNNPTLIPFATVTYTSPGTTGSLSYTPIPTRSGSAVITVTVTDNGVGTNTFFRQFTVTVTAPPTISSLAPGAGTTAGGTPVSIFGSGFTSPVTVTIGGVAPTNIVVVNSTKITATTPAHAAGPATVVVTNPDTQSSTRPSGFTYLTTTSNDNFANRFVLTGQGTLTAGGSNVGGTVEVNEPADAVGAVAPADSSVWWTWTAPCTFTVSSTTSFIDTIGSSFDTVLAVYTGSSLATLTEFASDDESGGTHTSRVPTAGSLAIGAGTTFQIRVRGVAAAQGSIVLHVNASACSGPAVTSIAPNSGPAAGGTFVAIIGTDFLPGATVSIGGVGATIFATGDPTAILATTGPHAAGTVDVVVTNPGLQGGTLTNGFTYVAPTQPSSGPPSDSPSAPTPTPLQPPGAPTALASAVSGRTVTLFWNAPSLGGAPTTYVIEAGTVAGARDAALFSTNNTETSRTVENVGANSYFVRVRAQNAAGESAPSNEVIVAVGGGTPPTLPGVPSGLAANVAGSSVTLTWQSPGPPGGVAASYQIEAGSEPGLSDLANFSTGSDAPSVTLATVPAGSYFVRARAVNAAGMSGPSNEAQVIVGGACPPSAPTGLRFAITGSTVTLAWNGSSGANSYVVSVGSAPGSSNLAVIDTGNQGTSAVATNVGAGTYFVRVAARSACGIGGTSNEVAIVVQ